MEVGPADSHRVSGVRVPGSLSCDQRGSRSSSRIWRLSKHNGRIATTRRSLGRSKPPIRCASSRSPSGLRGHAVLSVTTRPLPACSIVRGSLQAFPRRSARRSSLSTRTGCATTLKSASRPGRRTSPWTCCVPARRTRWRGAHRFLRGAHASLGNSSPHGGARERRREGRLAQEPCGRVHPDFAHVAHRVRQSDLRRGRMPLRRGDEAAT